MAKSKFLSKLQDTRVDCWSALVEMQVGEYIALAETAYQNRGGIKHQREALKTTSAKRIRTRLVDDLKRGAIIPPIVIGIVISDVDWDKIQLIVESESVAILLEKYKDELSIIDGMQRTTALKDAFGLDNPVENYIVRVEAWIAKTAESLIYRMLVLNTGQVPWNLKQQLEVVYAPLIRTISEKVQFSRLLNPPERRWQGGEFRSDSLIESYIAFGLRRTDVDTQESLADEFSRLDVADALTAKKYDQYFYRVVQMLVDLDVAVSRFNEVLDPKSAPVQEGDDGVETSQKRRNFVRGRNIFDSQAARVGFVVACAMSILGRVGMDKDDEFGEQKCEKLVYECSILVSKLRKLSSEELGEFLALGVQAEKLSRHPSSAVGRWERAFFEKSFKVLIDEDFKVPSFEACWRA